MQRILHAFTCVAVLVAMSASLPSAAKATSPYDNLVVTTGNLHVQDGSNTPIDVTTSYLAHMDNLCNSGIYDSFINDVLTADPLGSWAVYQYESSGDTVVRLAFTDVTPTSIQMSYPYQFWDASVWNSSYSAYGYSVFYEGFMEISASGDSVICHSQTSMSGSYMGDTLFSTSSVAPVTLTNAKIFKSVWPTVYPTGYEGALIPTTTPSAKYVAMGDSFSSGEGNPSFEYGTDVASANECHRSPKAYPRLLQFDSGLDLGTTAFVACSGATTANVLYGGSSSGAWDEDPQVDALSETTEVVTITIGGNDVGFKEYATICVLYPCGPGLGQSAYDAIMDNVDDSAFSENLQTTYEAILEGAENADVYVLDYPYLFDPTGEDDTGCTIADASGSLLVQQELNAVIALAVAEVRSESQDFSDRLKYVNTNEEGSPFEGKHLCTDDLDGSSFNNINLLNDEYSLHPNDKGHTDYYSIMEELLD